MTVHGTGRAERVAQAKLARRHPDLEVLMYDYIIIGAGSVLAPG